MVNLLSEIYDRGDIGISRTDMVRDSNSFIIASRSYELNSNDTIWTDYLNTYDKNSGTLESKMIIRGDSTIAGRFRTRYDKNKSIIEDTELDSLNNEITKNIYAYLAPGKLLKQTFYKKGILISTTQYTYNGLKKIEAIQTSTSKELKILKVKYIYQ